jgi:hypothetical protein
LQTDGAVSILNSLANELIEEVTVNTKSLQLLSAAAFLETEAALKAAQHSGYSRIEDFQPDENGDFIGTSMGGHYTVAEMAAKLDDLRRVQHAFEAARAEYAGGAHPSGYRFIVVDTAHIAYPSVAGEFKAKQSARRRVANLSNGLSVSIPNRYQLALRKSL